jgi:hypothetical protein
MEITEHTRDRVVIHQSQWSNGGFGLLLLAVGIGVLLISGFHLVLWIVGAGFAAGGTLFLRSADDRSIVFDGRARKVTLEIRNRRTSTHTEIAFDQIRDLALERNVEPGRGYSSWVYRATFVLNDGERIPWTSEWTNDGGGRSRCVAAAREFGGWAGGAEALPTAPVEQLAPWARTRSSPLTTAFLLLLSGVLLAEAVAMGYRRITWRPVTARIVQVTVERPSEISLRKLPGRIPHISYRYTVDGVQYMGNRITPLESWIKVGGTAAWAGRLAIQYLPGNNFTAYVNPGNPREAFLSRDAVPVTYLLFPGLVILSYTLFASWLQARRRAWAGAAQPVPIFTSNPWAILRQASP